MAAAKGATGTKAPAPDMTQAPPAAATEPQEIPLPDLARSIVDRERNRVRVGELRRLAAFVLAQEERRAKKKSAKDGGKKRKLAKIPGQKRKK